MQLCQIFEMVEKENIRSKGKYGFWRHLPECDHAYAINGEFKEWQDAYYANDVDGEHGEITEAIQTMNVLARRIMFLTGEREA